MAWTQTDIDALKQAIASGQLSVRSGDRSIQYRSLSEMREALSMMESEVITGAARRRTRSYFTVKRP